MFNRCLSVSISLFAVLISSERINMKGLLPILVLLGLFVFCMCTEGEDQWSEINDLSEAMRTMREAADSHARLRRACSWWYKWQVHGASVDSADVTNQLQRLFQGICNKYGK